MRVVYVLLVSALLFGCFTSKKTIEEGNNDQSQIRFLQKEYPEYSEMDYKQGKLLYENNCSTCHGFKNPKNYSKEELEKIVPGMVRKSNQKKGTSLTSLDSDLIFKYMLALSQ